MKNDVYFEDNAIITNPETGIEFTAEVSNMKKEQSFVAWIENNRIKFKWTGKNYMSRTVGMELISDGPKEMNVRRK